MAFNSDAYHMRKWREYRDRRLADARNLKTRAADPNEPWPWQCLPERIAAEVRAARSANNIFRHYRSSRALRRQLRGMKP